MRTPLARSNPLLRALTSVAVLGCLVTMVALPIATSAGAARPTRTAGSSPNSFATTVLVSQTAGHGKALVDSNLANAWGLAASGSSPIWVSDNNSGKVTVYSGGISGSAATLDLTVSVPGLNATGQVYNTTLGLPKNEQAFPVGGATGSPAQFIISSDSAGSHQSPGQIEAWNGGSHFVVEDSPKGGPGGTTLAGAVFKGLAVASSTANGPELFAADVANARVDIFDGDFAPVAPNGEFTDPAIPKGYAPFNVQVIGTTVYVTYGKQNGDHTNVMPGAGWGFVDVYTVDGVLVKHLIPGGTGSALNEPWGVVIAPSTFGPFADDLLVGNLGDGHINAYDPSTGTFLGDLWNRSGAPMVIPGLWGLRVGNSAFGGKNSVIFSAGPKHYNAGLLGVINLATPRG